MTAEKYFVALNFAPCQIDVLSAVADRINDWSEMPDPLLKHGHRSVFDPMKPSKYHITLAVIESDISVPVDIVQLQRILNVALNGQKNGLIHLSSINRFDEGAVYMEVEDSHGLLSKLRNVVIRYARDHEHYVQRQSCFHVTLFRSNRISSPALICDGYRRDPLEFKVGIHWPGSTYNEEHSMTKFYVARVNAPPGDFSLNHKLVLGRPGESEEDDSYCGAIGYDGNVVHDDEQVKERSAAKVVIMYPRRHPPTRGRRWHRGGGTLTEGCVEPRMFTGARDERGKPCPPCGTHEKSLPVEDEEEEEEERVRDPDWPSRFNSKPIERSANDEIERDPDYDSVDEREIREIINDHARDTCPLP